MKKTFYMHNEKNINSVKMLHEFQEAKKMIKSIGIDIKEFEEVQSKEPAMFACAVGDFLDGITFLLADIRDNSRNLETQVARKYFLDHGITVIYNDSYFWEGQGDTVKDYKHNAWFGYGFRTDPLTLSGVTRYYMDKNIPVFGVELTNKEFFYLNKCFLPTPNNGIIYCPEVIETKSVALIEQMFDKKYPLTFDEAKSFVTNSIIFGNYWVLSETSKEIAEKINKDLKLKLLFINMENIEKETSLSLRSLFLQGV